MAGLIAGQGVTEIARQYELDPSLVSRWKANQLPELAKQAKHQFGELLADYLEDLLVTVRAQQVFFRNEDWLKTQSAADLAVLHGVSIDKGVRLFEAAANARSSSPD